MGRREDAIKEFTNKYTKVCKGNNEIDVNLFEHYGVKRGLRDKNGKGVLSGLTNVSLDELSEKRDS